MSSTNASLSINDKVISYSEEFFPRSVSCIPCFVSTPLYGNLSYSVNS
jgi:hypothetical protein